MDLEGMVKRTGVEIRRLAGDKPAMYEEHLRLLEELSVTGAHRILGLRRRYLDAERVPAALQKAYNFDADEAQELVRSISYRVNLMIGGPYGYYSVIKRALPAVGKIFYEVRPATPET